MFVNHVVKELEGNSEIIANSRSRKDILHSFFSSLMILGTVGPIIANYSTSALVIMLKNLSMKHLDVSNFMEII